MDRLGEYRYEGRDGSISARRCNMKMLAAVLVIGMLLVVGVAVAGAQQSNPTHSIDLSQAKTTTNNVVNAGAVQPSTGTVHNSTGTVHMTTPPPGSIPGSGGRPRTSAPPPPPSKK